MFKKMLNNNPQPNQPRNYNSLGAWVLLKTNLKSKPRRMRVHRGFLFLTRNIMRIIEQYLTPEGVVTKYEDEEIQLRPYLINEDGQEYVELFPNDN